MENGEQEAVSNCVGVLGATSMVGRLLLPRLVLTGYGVVAYSRQEHSSTDGAVEWRQLSSLTDGLPRQATFSEGKGDLPFWICAAPIWVLPEYFSLMEALGIRRLVALSSTSRFTKGESSDLEEQAIAQHLADAESSVQAWAEDKGVEWVILRPTLIYGLGLDKNLTEIARIISRFGFFPLLGQAKGLRQPVHADDVAGACVAALSMTRGTNRAYNISGGETLTYREMVARVFSALGKRPRFIPVPLSLFKLAVVCLRLLPRYRHWSVAMAERMNRDLDFEHADASKNLGYKPKAFVLSKKDILPSKY